MNTKRAINKAIKEWEYDDETAPPNCILRSDNKWVLPHPTEKKKWYKVSYTTQDDSVPKINGATDLLIEDFPHPTESDWGKEELDIRKEFLRFYLKLPYREIKYPDIEISNWWLDKLHKIAEQKYKEGADIAITKELVRSDRRFGFDEARQSTLAEVKKIVEETTAYCGCGGHKNLIRDDIIKELEKLQ